MNINFVKFFKFIKNGSIFIFVIIYYINRFVILFVIKVINIKNVI